MKGLVRLLAVFVIVCAVWAQISTFPGGSGGGGGGDSTVVANSGTGAEVLKSATNVTARSILAGLGIVVTENTDDISIATDTAVVQHFTLGAGAPSSAACDAEAELGKIYYRNDGAAANSTFYVCSNTAASTFAWELLGAGGGASPTTQVHYFPVGARSGSANNLVSPWMNPTTGNATAALVGTDPTQIVADFDAATDENLSFRWRLPSNFNAAGDTTFLFTGQAAATTGNVILAVETGCNGDDETYLPSFNTVQNATWTPSGTTTGRKSVSLTLTMTGCAAGESFLMRVARDADNASDTMTGDFRLVSGTFTIPIS